MLWKGWWRMTTGRLTNVLLLLVFLALVANLLVPVFKTQDAGAVVVSPDSVSPAVRAAEVDAKLAPDRLTGELAAALKDIADADQQIAVAILEHSRSNENIAYALERIANEMKSQREAK